MLKHVPSHWLAVLQALLVTFLWSTSWVLIKAGLTDIPALTFAGLRYSMAFLCLLPFLVQSANLAVLRSLPARRWLDLALLGLLFYAATQGAQFLGLACLPAVTVNLLLNLTSIIVAILGMVFLAEAPSRAQWGGMGLFLTGLVSYFYPARLPTNEVSCLVIVLGGVLANALSSILGRRVNRTGDLPPVVVTGVSLGVGAAVLLIGGAWLQGVPALGLRQWAIVAWLAVVNTAFAFTLWNHTLRSLRAMESSIINGTMLVQIAILAWLFLGERLGGRELVGLALAGLGALAVQLGRREPRIHPSRADIPARQR